MGFRKPKETDLVKQCLDLLALRGVFAWRQNQGAVSGEYKGKRRFIRFAGADGISDIIGVLPGGKMLAVECKMPGNKPTPEQLDFMQKVRHQGGIAVVIYDAQELIDALTELWP